MLTAATLGLAGYGIYSVIVDAIDLFTRTRVEVWADLLGIVFGLLLLLSAAFVRVLMPGGLALALGALLGLQALSVHGASHTPVGLTLLPQLVRGLFALLLLGMAYVGAKEARDAGFRMQNPAGPAAEVENREGED
ncbi:MAG: hypothetical protein ACM3NQ_09445 [Bacteroidales bacterium]